jgi:hypothetical protein
MIVQKERPTVLGTCGAQDSVLAHASLGTKCSAETSLAIPNLAVNPLADTHLTGDGTERSPP